MLGLFSGIWDTYRKNQENLDISIFRTPNHIFIKVLRRNQKQTRPNKKQKNTQQKNTTKIKQ